MLPGSEIRKSFIPGPRVRGQKSTESPSYIPYLPSAPHLFLIFPLLLTYSYSSLCSSPIPTLPSAPHLFPIFPLLLTYYPFSLSSSPIPFPPSVPQLFSHFPLLLRYSLSSLHTYSLSFFCSSLFPSSPFALRLFPP
jgi:hypothetical protein